MKYGYHIFLAAILLVVSLMITGFFSAFAEKIMTHSYHRHLDSVATLQELRFEDTFEQFLTNIQLVQSRTNMRKQLSSYHETGDQEALDTVKRILTDAVKSVPIMHSVSLYSPNHQFLLSTDSALDGHSSTVQQDFVFDTVPDDEIGLKGISAHGSNSALFHFSAPLYWNELLVGYLEVRFSAEHFLSITETYAGLGETGETGFALRGSGNSFLSLTRLRHKDNSLLNVGDITDKEGNSPIRKALNGHQELYTRGITDYRSQPVFAVTRHLDKFDKHWGLTVKIDKDEALADYERFKLLIIFTVFGGLTGIALFTGLYLLVTQTLMSASSRKKK